ncbi:alanine racemase [Enteractinococcus coprophilus]|uniref:D-serine deaminase-like pyridoxal phosphate-dependent protein n=1 Tax=Enteractinococcus coprophilus TaxID=1027633 RepID=A0A543A0I9_9MICC|nr:alanine racemase [Enteractinococcus coprophilus]TQL66107.1 D-serine deaminase-like pyridoxal phosphate-dependent protein [Enteractinococcus coprophilus]
MDTSFRLLPPGQPLPGQQHLRLDAACHNLDAPMAVLDLHALSANAHDLLARARGKPVRISSKSIRSVEVLKALLALEGFAGVLALSLDEAIMLVHMGVTDDVVVGYPTVASNALGNLLRSAELLSTITLMIDHPDQLRAIQDVGTPVAPVRICLDLDTSLKFGPFHIGARRSPIHRASQARAAAEYITASPQFQLVGVMGYEAHIAGLTDANPAIRALKRIAMAELSARRPSMVAAVQAVLTERGVPELEFVNGGGTGSLEFTTSDESVTELAAGSGLYGPYLFDHYARFTPHPAAFFGLDAVRAPRARMITVHGGGWIASGPPGADRLPQPTYPPGLRYTSTEGAGEVQTPLTSHKGRLHIGQRVWFRHTKAGELAEHVNHFYILTQQSITARVSTYRGDGYAFL